MIRKLSKKAQCKAIRWKVKKSINGKLHITLPYNDYLIGGKVFTGCPTVYRKVYWDGPWGPYIRADKRRFYLRAEVADPNDVRKENGGRYRAFVHVLA